MSKSKLTSSSPNNKVKAQYFNRSVGISSGKGGQFKKGKPRNGGTIPDVLPPAPFPHLKGKP